MKDIFYFYLKTTFNVCLCITAIFTFSFMLSEVGEIFSPQRQADMSFLIGFSTLLGFISLSCSGILAFRLREMIAISQLKEEQKILAMAKERGGVLPLSDTALGGEMSIVATKRALARLAGNGICYMTYSDSCICYRFPSFDPSDESQLLDSASPGRYACSTNHLHSTHSTDC